jgi:hypothetical protein
VLQRLRKSMHRFAKTWVALFALAWLTVAYPPCAAAQPRGPEQPSAVMQGHHDLGDHGAMHGSAVDASDASCLGDDCPVLSAVEKQAAPKPSVADGDLHPVLTLVAPLLRLPVLDDHSTDPAGIAARTPLPAFPPALGFRILLI